MIRPVDPIDLPGIYLNVDRWARSKHREFAHFVVRPEENHQPSSLPLVLPSLWPFNPVTHTWICEHDWRTLGLAQARTRPTRNAWDITYLASVTNDLVTDDEVLLELLEYVVDAASQHGIPRVFAKIDDDARELEMFARVGFQRYCREYTFYAQSPPVSATSAVPELRPWHSEHEWSLYRLYVALTPRKIINIEGMNSKELAMLRIGPRAPWPLSLLDERRRQGYVFDLGVKLGGWLQIEPAPRNGVHRLSLMIHPENSDLARPLLDYGLYTLQALQKRPVLCHVREYETAVISALRDYGFDQVATHGLLVRYTAERVMERRFIPALEKKVVYGVEGLGSATSRNSQSTRGYKDLC